MRGRRVGGYHVAALRFALGLAAHEHLNAAGQHRDLSGVAGDNIRQLFCQFGQMGYAFFKGGQVCHRLTKGHW